MSVRPSLYRLRECLLGFNITFIKSSTQIFPSYIFPIVFFLFDIILDLAPLSEDRNRLDILSFFKLLFPLWIKLWVILWLLSNFVQLKYLSKHMRLANLQWHESALWENIISCKYELDFIRIPDIRWYNLPISNEIAAVFIGKNGAPAENKGIMIYLNKLIMEKFIWFAILTQCVSFFYFPMLSFYDTMLYTMFIKIDQHTFYCYSLAQVTSVSFANQESFFNNIWLIYAIRLKAVVYSLWETTSLSCELHDTIYHKRKPELRIRDDNNEFLFNYWKSSFCASILWTCQGNTNEEWQARLFFFLTYTHVIPEIVNN